MEPSTPRHIDDRRYRDNLAGRSVWNETRITVHIVVAPSKIVSSDSPVSVGACGKSIQQRYFDLDSLQGSDRIKADNAGEGVYRGQDRAVDASSKGTGRG